MKHNSYKGSPIDMELLKFQHQHNVALGNAHMNARGDIIGNGGIVKKTREELLAEKEVEMFKADANPEQITTTNKSINTITDSDDDLFTFNPNAEVPVEDVPSEPEVIKPKRKTQGDA